MRPIAERIPWTGGRAIALLEHSLRLRCLHRVGTLAVAIIAAAMLALGWPSRAAAQTFQEFPVPTGGSQPGFITAGPDGALWFTEVIASKIGRITTAGVITNPTAE